MGREREGPFAAPHPPFVARIRCRPSPSSAAGRRPHPPPVVTEVLSLNFFLGKMPTGGGDASTAAATALSPGSSSTSWPWLLGSVLETVPARLPPPYHGYFGAVDENLVADQMKAEIIKHKRIKKIRRIMDDTYFGKETKYKIAMKKIQGASRTSSSDKGKALLNHRSASQSPPTMSGPVSSRSLSLSLISVGTNTKYLRTILALEFQSRNKVTETEEKIVFWVQATHALFSSFSVNLFSTTDA